MNETSWHNTTNEEGEVLKKLDENAKCLEAEILPIYKGNPSKAFAWPEINEILIGQGKKRHEGSIKRALSNLQDKYKEIIITGEKIISPYNKPCHRYKLAA